MKNNTLPVNLKTKLLENFLKATKNIEYKPKDVSQLLGLSKRTLDRYDQQGMLKSFRTGTNRRYYTLYQIMEFLSL